MFDKKLLEARAALDEVCATQSILESKTKQLALAIEALEYWYSTGGDICPECSRRKGDDHKGNCFLAEALSLPPFQHPPDDGEGA